LNIIEYLFYERLFGKVLLIEKSAAKKSRQENCAKKEQQTNHERKSAEEKVR